MQTVASVSAATELSRMLVRGILMTLAELGIVVSDGKNFRPTPEILNLSVSYLTSLPIPPGRRHSC